MVESIALDIGPAREDEMSRIQADWKDSSVSAVVEPLREKLRELLPDDRWIADEKVFGKLCHTLYERKMNPEVDAVLATRPMLLVAREPSDPSFLYGWIACGHVQDKLAVYFAYTKRRYRELGVMTALLLRVLELVPDAELVYCAHGPRDSFFQKMGFVHVPLKEVVDLSVRRA